MSFTFVIKVISATIHKLLQNFFFFLLYVDMLLSELWQVSECWFDVLCLCVCVCVRRQARCWKGCCQMNHHHNTTSAAETMTRTLKKYNL